MGISIHPKRRKAVKILLILIVLIVAVRLALPFVILHYANKTLAEMKGYRGHIEDIDLAIIRGAYQIDSMYLNKVDSTTRKETPFFAVRTIDLSVEWKALFHGSIVGELVFDAPMLRFTKDKVEPKEVRKDSTSFSKLLEDFMPLEVNRFEVREGRLQYKDENASPKVDVELSNTYVLAQNLKNSYDSSSVLPARVRISADVYEGTLACNVKLNPLAEMPTFDLNAEVKNTNLVKLNDFFKAYAKVDVNQGRFGLYAEAAAKQGGIAGYVKPVVKDLDILGAEDREDNTLRKLWEGLVGGVGQVLTNPKKDQVATKVPFRGSIKKSDTNVWFAIANVLQNAFIQALQPTIDNEITISSVDNPKKEKKNLLEKIFGGKDEKKDEQKK